MCRGARDVHDGQTLDVGLGYLRGVGLQGRDLLLENGVHIETGPHKHAVQQTFFLYVYEPGGNRIEIDSAGARLMLAPDWQPVVWTETERKKGQAWGLKTIDTFHTYGTPPIEQYTGPRK